MDSEALEEGGPHLEGEGGPALEGREDAARPPLKSRKLTPHMASVIVHLEEQGSLQLFSCGTAELLVESCSEVWDGNGITPMSDSERRRIIEFYNKTSTTMACYAFACVLPTAPCTPWYSLAWTLH